MVILRGFLWDARQASFQSRPQAATSRRDCGSGSLASSSYNPVTDSYSPTTNQWVVALTTVASGGLQINHDGGPYDPIYGQTSTYYSIDPSASIATSPLMTVPYQGTVGWQYVSVDLTADAPTELLSFLAWGDNGSTVNLPPIAFLSGVDSPNGLVPEPSTWVMMAMGFVGLGLVGRRQLKKRTVATA